MKSKLASRIVVTVLAGLVGLFAVVVFVSAAGFLPLVKGTVDSQTYVMPEPTPVPPGTALEPVNQSLAPDQAGIKQKLAALSLGQATVSYAVTDLSGSLLAAQDADIARIPASSWKILVSLAALTAFGADHQFTTSVVASSTGIVLVGGGDPYLTTSQYPATGQASIRDLATKTAQALAKAGRLSVTLGYDDSLFSGPQWNPAWQPEWSADVAPVSALSASPDGDSTSDTSLAAATVFRDLLVQQGINVTTFQAQRTNANPQLVASVDSWPLGQMVQHILSVSNNFGAEVLFRHLGATSGQDGSVASAAAALQAFLRAHDLWSDQMSISDGSGLAMTDKVPAMILAAAIRLAYDTPGLEDILDGLPVAGVDGTLAERFDQADAAGGRGIVHAKTGTNDYVRSLTGFAQTSSGAIVIFSFILNDLQDDAAGVDWLDQAATILAES